MQTGAKYMRIRNSYNDVVLFFGYFKTQNMLIESAVEKKIDLNYADFSNFDLRGANMDGLSLRYANFTNADCTGINLSECDLSHAKFKNTFMEGACLAESTLNNATFSNCTLIGTDIAYSKLHNVSFYGHTVRHLNFSDAQSIKDCTYQSDNKETCRFSSAPMTIKGRGKTVLFFDEHVEIQDCLYPLYSNEDNKIIEKCRALAHGIEGLSEILQTI